MIIARRSFLIGLGALFAAPAIVHAENIMRVRARLVLRGPVMELIGISDIYGDDGVGDIISTYGKQELDDIAARIMAAQLVVLR